ncbi:MAG: adenosine kinase [Alphaproteobacteria bacterium]|nr:adenosine kinase [Alphaproteobacteria bacterium]
MTYDVAGLGNALMDALVVVDDAEALLDRLGLVRGTMHPVDHAEWEAVHKEVAHLDVVLESGGSCANTIATVGRLGARAVYRGQVGDDALGQTYADRLADACGEHLLRVSSDAPTGKCLSIVSRQDAERTMVTDLGASVLLPDLGGFADVLRSTRIAHFTGYTLLGGAMEGVVRQALPLARDAGALVSVDVADPFVVGQLRDTLWRVLAAYADVVFLNAEEARALTDRTPEHAAETIASEAGVKTVVVKLGSRGSLVLHDGEAHEIGVRKVEAIDTTGAGDAYAGGFLYGLARGWAPETCGALASAVAAETVAQLGAVVKDGARLRALAAELAPR